MQLTEISALGRPLDPHYPTNMAIAALTGIVVLAATLYRWSDGTGLLPAALEGIVAGLSVFLAWALARELDPDHDWSAFVAAGLALAGLPIFASPSLLLLFWILLLIRMLDRTVGLPATSLDSLVILVLAGWLTWQGNWIVGLVTVLAFLWDNRLPRPSRGQLPFAIVAFLVTTTAVSLHGFAPGANGLSWLALVIGLVTSLLFLLVMLAPHDLISVGDRTGEPLVAVRVRAAQITSLLIAVMVGLWQGNAGMVAVLPLWAAMLGVALYALPGILGIVRQPAQTQPGEPHQRKTVEEIDDA